MAIKKVPHGFFCGWLWVTAVLIWPSYSLAVVVSEFGPGQESISDFHQLAANLRKTPRAVRADFALAAIAELLAIYRVETSPGKLAVDSDKKAQWVRGVEDYSHTLRQLARSITPNTSVRIQRGEDAFIYLQVNGRPVILGSPRANQQALYERKVIAHFCGQYPCDGLIDGYSERRADRIDTLPHWRFRVGPVPSCSTGDGLELMFNSHLELLEKREICKQLFRELAALARALARQRARGVVLDWAQITVRDVPASRLDEVVLNAGGETIQMALPGCAASPKLLSRVLPWLMSRAQGEAYHGVLLVVTNTEELIPQLL